LNSVALCTFGSTVNILSAINSFWGNKVDSVLLVLIRVSEVHTDEWSSTTWVMDQLTYHPLHIAVTLCEVQMAVQGIGHSLVLVGSEHGVSLSFSLRYAMKWKLLPLIRLPIVKIKSLFFLYQILKPKEPTKFFINNRC
jgi:hypothetical protein